MLTGRCEDGHTNAVFDPPIGTVNPRLRRCVSPIDEDGGTCGKVITFESPSLADHTVPQITDLKQF